MADAHSSLSLFAQDILIGLSAKKKNIPHIHQFDEVGTKIMEDIIKMPVYYVKDCEMEILTQKASEIYNSLNFSNHFNVIDLGCGEGFKALELLKHFQPHHNLTYIPIDIGTESVSSTETLIQNSFPDLKMIPLVGDYFEVLHQLPEIKTRPNLYLFLGASIGNFYKEDAVIFLEHVVANMQKGDKLLIGCDLQKSPHVIRKAYGDQEPPVKEFSIHLIDRMKNELDAEISRDNFDVYSCYSPENGEVRVYLVSLCKQEIFFKKLNTTFNFDEGETILTGCSIKYTLDQLQNLAKGLGFEIVHNFIDSKNYFTVALWMKT